MSLFQNGVHVFWFISIYFLYPPQIQGWTTIAGASFGIELGGSDEAELLACWPKVPQARAGSQMPLDFLEDSFSSVTWMYPSFYFEKLGADPGLWLPWRDFGIMLPCVFSSLSAGAFLNRDARAQLDMFDIRSAGVCLRCHLHYKDGSSDAAAESERPSRWPVAAWSARVCLPAIGQRHRHEAHQQSFDGSRICRMGSLRSAEVAFIPQLTSHPAWLWRSRSHQAWLPVHGKCRGGVHETLERIDSSSGVWQPWLTHDCPPVHPWPAGRIESRWDPWAAIFLRVELWGSSCTWSTQTAHCDLQTPGPNHLGLAWCLCLAAFSWPGHLRFSRLCWMVSTVDTIFRNYGWEHQFVSMCNFLKSTEYWIIKLKLHEVIWSYACYYEGIYHRAAFKYNYIRTICIIYIYVCIIFNYFSIYMYIYSMYMAGWMTCRGHCSKNTAGQATSMLRTVFYGQFWCDYTKAREHSMPPGALGRESPQSDYLQAVFSNPYFLVTEEVPRL